MTENINFYNQCISDTKIEGDLQFKSTNCTFDFNHLNESGLNDSFTNWTESSRRSWFSNSLTQHTQKVTKYTYLCSPFCKRIIQFWFTEKKICFNIVTNSWSIQLMPELINQLIKWADSLKRIIFLNLLIIASAVRLIFV